jgi:hypothetical protein
MNMRRMVRLIMKLKLLTNPREARRVGPSWPPMPMRRIKRERER